MNVEEFHKKIKEVEQLPDSELQARIAEFCGWTWTKDCIRNIKWEDWEDGWQNRHTQETGTQLPDYVNDLNAMAEAYKYAVSISKHYMSSPQPDRIFNLYLMKTVNPDVELWDNGRYLGNHWHALRTAHATARERAIAFVKMIISQEKEI